MAPLPTVPDGETHAARAERWHAVGRLLSLACAASALTGVAALAFMHNPVAPSPVAAAAPWAMLAVFGALWFAARARSRAAARLDADQRTGPGAPVPPKRTAAAPRDGAAAALASGRGVVVFGALFVLSLTGAGVTMVTPENVSDSPGRVLIVSDSDVDYAGWLQSWFHFRTEQLTPEELSARTRTRLGRTSESLSGSLSGSLADAMALADAEGVGFVVLDLDTSGELNLDASTALTAPVRSRSETDQFVAVAIGDLVAWDPQQERSVWGPGRYPWQAPASSTPSFGGSEVWVDDADARARLSLMRALFAQPAFAAQGDPATRNHSAEPGNSAALMWGQIHHGLPDDFWALALLNVERAEQILAKGRTPEFLSDPP